MYDEELELKELKKEENILDDKNESYKSQFAEKLLYGGLGDEIINQLSSPYKVTRTQLLKIKIKNFFKTLFEIL